MRSTRQEAHDDNLAANQAARAAQRRLMASAYAGLRSVRCEYRRGALILNGRVSTYFHKQLAQETVRSLPGVTKIVNQISVRRGAAGTTQSRDMFAPAGANP